ncbi:MAG: hypothetical protein ACRCWC_14370, partial [Plesiomonas shigelloides]
IAGVKEGAKHGVKEHLKDQDAYATALEGNKFLVQAEDILRANPNDVAGFKAAMNDVLGKIHPGLVNADRATFTVLMRQNVDQFKKLLGPQISNPDAVLMFQLAGADERDAGKIQATINILKERNTKFITRYQDREASIGGAAPASRPYINPGVRPPTAMPLPPDISAKASAAVKEGQAFTFSYKGERYKGVKRNGKLVFE